MEWSEKEHSKVYKPRHQWGASPALKGVPPRQWQARHVFCSYNEHPWVNKDNLPAGFLSTIRELQLRQNMDFKLGYPDIRYNFMITQDGTTYEGRGWKFNPGLTRHHAKYSPDSVYIAYIGDYAESPPSEFHQLARDELIVYGTKTKFIRPKFTLWNIALPIRYKVQEFEKYMFLNPDA